MIEASVFHNPWFALPKLIGLITTLLCRFFLSFYDAMQTKKIFEKVWVNFPLKHKKNYELYF